MQRLNSWAKPRVADAERSEARCGLENESEFMGFCVFMILAAQAAQHDPVWKSGNRTVGLKMRKMRKTHKPPNKEVIRIKHIQHDSATLDKFLRRETGGFL